MSSETIYSIIIGILVSILIGYYFYNKGKQKRYLSYVKNSSTLINKLDDDFYNGINITFCNQKIDKLTSTVFRVWNSGNAAILKQDIAQLDPLKIHCNSKILTSRIVKKSEDSFQIATLHDAEKKSIVLDLDFLEKDNGFICEIIHTGQSSDLSFSGKIIGGNISHVKVLFLNSKRKSTVKWLIASFGFIFIYSILLLLTIFEFIPKEILLESNIDKVYAKYIFAVTIGIVMIMCLSMMVFLYKKAFKKIPSSLID